MTDTRKVTEAQKKFVAARQFYKCANNNSIQLKGLEDYSCPLWNKIDNQGLFDTSGYDIDHITEHCLTGDDSEKNLQALCISCHRVKTKLFNMSHKSNQNQNQNQNQKQKQKQIKIRNTKHKIFGKLLTCYGNHKVYLSSSKEIYKHTKIWSKNRPVDKSRLKPMADYFTKNEHIDGIIYLAILEEEGIVCYDGNHRRESIQFMEDNYSVMVDVIEQPNKSYLRDRFKSINQCVPISVLDENPEEFTDKFKYMIYSVVDTLSQKWPEHKVIGPNPRRPNFNRDKLINTITDIIINNMIYIENEEILLEAIEKYNDYIKKNIGTYKISTNILEKCNRNNCYIFLDKNLDKLVIFFF
jgi:hypothetical protein